jgi:hypothetical protein
LAACPSITNGQRKGGAMNILEFYERNRNLSPIKSELESFQDEFKKALESTPPGSLFHLKELCAKNTQQMFALLEWLLLIRYIAKSSKHYDDRRRKKQKNRSQKKRRFIERKKREAIASEALNNFLAGKQVSTRIDWEKINQLVTESDMNELKLEPIKPSSHYRFKQNIYSIFESCRSNLNSDNATFTHLSKLLNGLQIKTLQGKDYTTNSLSMMIRRFRNNNS